MSLDLVPGPGAPDGKIHLSSSSHIIADQLRMDEMYEMEYFALVFYCLSVSVYVFMVEMRLSELEVPEVFAQILFNGSITVFECWGHTDYMVYLQTATCN